MTISKVLELHYEELLSTCSRDSECDILSDVCLRAMRKYKNKEIEEEEGLSYLKRTLFAEKHFQYARKKNEIIIYTGNLEGMAGNI